MPNHIMIEVCLSELLPNQIQIVKSKVINADGIIDFEILLPLPLNYWWHGVSQRHERAFPGNAIDWCRKNWGTKWNAYGQGGRSSYKSVETTNSALVLRFQTAWAPPMGWLCALYNATKLGFSYTWYDEGSGKAYFGVFRSPEGFPANLWKEVESSESEAKRLYCFMYGEPGE